MQTGFCDKIYSQKPEWGLENDADFSHCIENAGNIQCNALVNCVCDCSHFITSFRARFFVLQITKARLGQEAGCKRSGVNKK